MAARIELIPTPEHCIETTARQEFTKAKDYYLRIGIEDKELEEKMELLRMFLEAADFRKPSRRAAEHCLDSGPKLDRVEGFSYVIIGAHLESEHLLCCLRLGSEHNDRIAESGASQLAANVKAVSARKHHVKENQIEGPFLNAV